MAPFNSENPLSVSLAPFVAGVLTLSIFVIDTFTPLNIAIAVLYGAVILVTSYVCSRRAIVGLTGLCLVLTSIGYITGHGFDDLDSGLGRFLVSLSAISIIAFLALKGQASTYALRQREEALREADRKKNEFLAMLAHELRNPLAPLSAAAKVLESSSNDAQVIREVSEILLRQTNHMKALVNELLDVSRVTRGVVELKKTATAIQQVVSDAVEQLQPAIDEKQHQLVLDLPQGALYVHGDYQRLVQVVANLLANSVKYTPPRGTISVKIQALAQQISIEVTDTGIGMPSVLLPHVFELFTQAERGPDRTQGGLGIGLALVKSLVELHKGQVSCHSAGVGYGSSFTVLLPKISLPARIEDSWEGPEEIVTVSQRRHILIVDDNGNAARMLGLYLKSQGHAVMTRTSFDTGIEAARTHSPDICLLDIGLPDHDGNELARQLRNDPRTQQMFLIAVSGYDQEKDKTTALAAGFDHYLVKPVDTDILNYLIATAECKNTAKAR